MSKSTDEVMLAKIFHNYQATSNGEPKYNIKEDTTLAQFYYKLPLAKAVAQLFFIGLFVWALIQNIPGMIPNKLSLKAAADIELALLISICIIFLWMSLGMYQTK